MYQPSLDSKDFILSGNLQKRSEYLGLWNERFFGLQYSKTYGLLLFYWKNSAEALSHGGLSFFSLPHKCVSEYSIPPRGAFCLTSEVQVVFKKHLDHQFSIIGALKVKEPKAVLEYHQTNAFPAMKLNPLSKLFFRASSGRTAECWLRTIKFISEISYQENQEFKCLAPVFESTLSYELREGDLRTECDLTNGSNAYWALYVSSIEKSREEKKGGRKHCDSFPTKKILLVGWRDSERRKKQKFSPEFLFDVSNSKFSRSEVGGQFLTLDNIKDELRDHGIGAMNLDIHFAPAKEDKVLTYDDLFMKLERYFTTVKDDNKIEGKEHLDSKTREASGGRFVKKQETKEEEEIDESPTYFCVDELILGNSNSQMDELVDELSLSDDDSLLSLELTSNDLEQEFLEPDDWLENLQASENQASNSNCPKDGLIPPRSPGLALVKSKLLQVG